MSEIYYALIIFPILFMIAMGFIYSSALSDIQVQQLKLNCPYPIYEGVANATLSGVNITYNITRDRDINGNPESDPQLKVGTNFKCGEDGQQSLSTTIKEYGSTETFTGFPYGWFVWASDTMTIFFQKVTALGALIPLFLNSPALVLAIPEYVYVNIVLISFVALGGFMVVRGG